MKGLRKDHVDKISADDLATALDDMKDTINEIVDAMDKTTLDSMIKKVRKPAQENIILVLKLSPYIS
jgi:hypothetical protein